MKICSKCKVPKDTSQFFKDKTNKEGFRSRCKECIKPSATKHYKEHKEDYKVSFAKYYNEHKAENNSLRMQRYYQNREKEIKRSVAYAAGQWKTNPTFKMAHTLRNRMRLALKGLKKSSTTELLGCTLEEARRYIENLFQPKMTWSNHGEWHIDHKKPCASFDLTKESEQLLCFHYTNLQPLWAADNLSKSDRVV